MRTEEINQSYLYKKGLYLMNIRLQNSPPKVKSDMKTQGSNLLSFVNKSLYILLGINCLQCHFQSTISFVETVDLKSSDCPASF